jgi:hypothetical protein
MKRFLCVLILMVASREAAFAQTPSINELRQMFDYDQRAPLDVQEACRMRRPF